MCPFCSSKDIRQGFVWTSDGIGGNGIAILDWAEGKEPPETRFILGRRRDARIIEGPDTPTAAYRCKSCNTFYLYQMELDEAPEDQGLEPDDTSEATDCLSCGETIEAGMSECPKCGWSYRMDE